MVNLRSMLSPHGPVEGSLEAPLATLLELKERGLIRHIGLSNVTAKQVADAQKMTPIVCVQNLYNVAHRADDALVDALAAQHIAWVPFFPLGGFTPLQAQELNEVAASLEATPMQVALAPAAPASAKYSADPRHLLPHAPRGKYCRCRAGPARGSAAHPR